MGLLDWLKGWRETETVPNWVLTNFHRQFKKNYYRGNKSPYDKIYYFKGKTFEYKIVVLGNVQGGSYYYYKRLRKK